MPPEFDELVDGDDLAPEDEARLRRVHELLVAAGPPPELPPELLAPPAERRAKVIGLPRRRLGAALVLAAAIAAAAFGGGYLVGHRTTGFTTERGPIAMHGTAGELASIRIGPVDGAGNWPLVLRVRGLPELPAGGYYELVLTRNGKLGPSCGTFKVHGDVTEVTMNAPYKLRRWNGWVIVRHVPGKSESAPLLST